MLKSEVLHKHDDISGITLAKNTSLSQCNLLLNALMFSDDQ